MENNITAAAPAKAVYKRPSQAKEIWRRFRKGKGAVVGLICLVIILLAVLVGPLLIPYENATTQNFSNYLAKPSAEHLFGCDGYGRDILARVIHGGKRRWASPSSPPSPPAFLVACWVLWPASSAARWTR